MFTLLLLFLLLLLLLLLLTAVEFSPGGSSRYASTDKTNKNKMYRSEQYNNTVKTMQNTVNTGTRITKTSTRYKTHTYTHPHITKQVKTTTVQDTHQVK